MGFLQEFDFPIAIEKDCDYIKTFNKKMDSFILRFEKLPSDESGFFKHLFEYPNKLREIKEKLLKNKRIIVKAFNNYLTGRVATAAKQIENLIIKHKNVLIISLKEAHAFLDEQFFFSQSLDKLYLYKGRVGAPYHNFETTEMSHIPFNFRSLVDTQRFSQPGVPCIYLASNSYIVWKELNCPQYDNLGISAFDIKCLDKNIIDLTYSFAQDIYQLSDEVSTDETVVSVFGDSVSIYPLILACSFVCNEANRKFKSEYVIPQLIMQSLRKVDCIGVAYRSNKIQSDHNLPATNLAIPIYETGRNKNYGRILKDIEITKPVNLGYFADNIYKKTNLSFDSANGIGAKNQMFQPVFPNIYSTFNKFVISQKSSLSYDGYLKYIDSLFFNFDEFILFHNRFEVFDSKIKKYK